MLFSATLQFREFDALVEKRGVYKVETINTVYVIAAGLPNPQENHAVLAALVAHDFMNAMTRHMVNGQHPKLKVGIHSGKRKYSAKLCPFSPRERGEGGGGEQKASTGKS